MSLVTIPENAEKYASSESYPLASKSIFSGRRSSRRKQKVSKEIYGHGFGCPHCRAVLPYTGTGSDEGKSTDDVKKLGNLDGPGLNRFPAQICYDCGSLVQYQAGIGGILLQSKENGKNKSSSSSSKAVNLKSNVDGESGFANKELQDKNVKKDENRIRTKSCPSVSQSDTHLAHEKSTKKAVTVKNKVGSETKENESGQRKKLPIIYWKPLRCPLISSTIENEISTLSNNLKKNGTVIGECILLIIIVLLMY